MSDPDTTGPAIPTDSMSHIDRAKRRRLVALRIRETPDWSEVTRICDEYGVTIEWVRRCCIAAVPPIAMPPRPAQQKGSEA